MNNDLNNEPHHLISNLFKRPSLFSPLHPQLSSPHLLPLSSLPHFSPPSSSLPSPLSPSPAECLGSFHVKDLSTSFQAQPLCPNHRRQVFFLSQGSDISFYFQKKEKEEKEKEEKEKEEKEKEKKDEKNKKKEKTKKKDKKKENEEARSGWEEKNRWRKAKHGNFKEIDERWGREDGGEGGEEVGGGFKSGLRVRKSDGFVVDEKDGVVEVMDRDESLHGKVEGNEERNDEKDEGGIEGVIRGHGRYSGGGVEERAGWSAEEVGRRVLIKYEGWCCLSVACV